MSTTGGLDNLDDETEEEAWLENLVLGLRSCCVFPASGNSFSKRIERIAAQGMKAFSFWAVKDSEERAMLTAQKRTGLACGSIAGSGRVGGTTGLTKTGFEQAYFDVITQNCEVAKRFGTPNLVIFVGLVQKGISLGKAVSTNHRGPRKGRRHRQKA